MHITHVVRIQLMFFQSSRDRHWPTAAGALRSSGTTSGISCPLSMRQRSVAVSCRHILESSTPSHRVPPRTTVHRYGLPRYGYTSVCLQLGVSLSTAKCFISHLFCSITFVSANSESMCSFTLHSARPRNELNSTVLTALCMSCNTWT